MASHCAGVDDEDPPMMPLHDCASCLIGFTHAIYDKIKGLPFPIGTAIRVFDAVCYPVLHELIESLECHGLNILAAIDHEVSSTFTSAKKCICSTASNFRLATSLVRKRGLIGASADFWIKYEALVKQEVEMALLLADKIPGANLISPLLCSISAPLARAICDWLLEQSSGKEVGLEHTMERTCLSYKGQDISYKNQNMSFEDHDISWKGQDITWKDKPSKDQDMTCEDQDKDGSPTKTIDHSFTVCSHSPVKNMDHGFTVYAESPVKNKDRCFTVCAESLHDADIPVSPQHDVEIQNDMKPDNDNVSIDTTDIVLVEEEPLQVKEEPVAHGNNENNVPDILEIFDSAWLLGKF